MVSLDELVPGCLPTMPTDPATGQPFGYTLLRRDAEGGTFLLYSFGADGVDDGGHVEPGSPYWATIPGMTGFDVRLNAPRDVSE